MAIQKKSLISNRETVKKAVIAKSTLEPQTVATPSKAAFKSAHVKSASRMASKSRVLTASRMANKSRVMTASRMNNKSRVL